MTDPEFDDQAASIAAQVLEADRQGELAPHERFAAACRGSANPAALAWIAESLQLHAGSRVIDLGSGLGGPSGWLAAHYGCEVIGLEPARRAAVASRTLFPLPVVNASSTKVPFRGDAFDVALLLGVVSVVPQRGCVLREALRVAHRLGVLDYCSTTSHEVCAGGSRFAPPADLAHIVAVAGWRVDQTSAIPVDAPRTWTDAAERISVPTERDEAEVADAIRNGAIAPMMLVGSR